MCGASRLAILLLASFAAIWAAFGYSIGTCAATAATPVDMTIAHELDVDVNADVGVRRVVLRADADRLATFIEVFRPGSGEPAQVLPAPTGEAPGGGNKPRLIVEDLNGDGYRDLMLLSWWGATGNAGYLAWRFEPRTGRYVEIPDFEQLSQPKVVPGTRCIRTRSNGGHLGAIHVLERWCWEDDRLVMVWMRRQTNEPDGRYLRVIHERRGGAMVEIERRRLSAEELDRANE